MQLVYSFVIYFPILCGRQKGPRFRRINDMFVTDKVVKSNTLLYKTPTQPGLSRRGNKGKAHFNHIKRQKMRTR